jgi:hypothetical protein
VPRVCMCYVCTAYVLRMYCVCIAYVLRMYCVCIAYVLRMYCVCIAYVLRMYCICAAYVAYVAYVLRSVVHVARAACIVRHQGHGVDTLGSVVLILSCLNS